MATSSVLSSRSHDRARIGFAGLLLVMTLALFAGRAQAFSALYSFGDSLSDTGNLTAVAGLPLAPYFPGHFSNGPVWVETLASNLGLSSNNAISALTPAPVFTGGTNFAFGGAQTGSPPAIVGPTSPPTLIQQSQLYLASAGGAADPNALYTVFGGGNDVRDGNITGSAANIGSVINALANAGATQFLVPNLPDIGKTPEAIAGGAALVAGATFLSTSFNTQLAAELQAQRVAHPGITIHEFDTFAFLNSVLANPGAFGFTVVDQPCFTGTTGVGGAGTVCANPDQYIFWDGIHPTSAMHALVGNTATALVPVPAAVWLFGSALGLLGWVRRRAA